VLAVPLGLIGALAVARRYHAMSARLRRWCIVATVLTGAYAVFSCTPPAGTIAVWVAD
jgi:hypothetical protein